MRTIRIIEHVSLDGVIQAPGGPGEDGDYPHGGWAVPHFDAAVGEAIDAAHGTAFDLLLGRRTYDIFAGYWPKAEKGLMADSLNAATKYVATHTWGPAEGLGPDVMEGVRRVKATDGPDLIVWGSSTLTPVLLEGGWPTRSCCSCFRSFWERASASSRTEPPRANSRSSARSPRPPASSSAPTGPPDPCGPGLRRRGDVSRPPDVL